MPGIYHEVFISAAAEKIYNAITTQEGLRAWWTPGAETSGELNSIARFYFGPAYFKEMKIAVLQPAHQVEWHCIAGAGEWIGTNISFTLSFADKQNLQHLHPEIKGQLDQDESNEGTLLSLTHKDWAAYTPMFAECNYTWAQFLRSLKLYCETGNGRPWPYQHRTNI